jgi:hypothetical protein
MGLFSGMNVIRDLLSGSRIDVFILRSPLPASEFRIRIEMLFSRFQNRFRMIPQLQSRLWGYDGEGILTKGVKPQE